MNTLSVSDHAPTFQGLTPEQAALTLTAFSVRFIRSWRENTLPTPIEVSSELAEILADNPISDIYQAMAMLLAEDGGCHPDDKAHFQWCSRAVAAALAGTAR
ncbi:hypothetical protein [Sphaerisporangium aureirubrum]|uniref:Uncharacterized protein n=1 Tax=Sphaerisporangium aureirubrum TaxID=1544736 RepID=A0ABW1NDY2_9ACTN